MMQQMPVIKLDTEIHAPLERCFDLARSIDFHVHSTARTGERAVAGVTSGLIGLDETVTWEGRHFGVVQQLTSRIVAFERPRYFRDEMIKGAFGRLGHDHHFEAKGDGLTRMSDVFDFSSPLGILGTLVDRWVMTRYLETFLKERNHLLKEAAEGSEWRRFLGVGQPP